MTKYHVLHKRLFKEQGDLEQVEVWAWVELGVFEAASDTAAKKKAAETLGLEGEFVGVPERNFKPEPFHKETTVNFVPGKPKSKRQTAKKAAPAATA